MGYVDLSVAMVDMVVEAGGRCLLVIRFKPVFSQCGQFFLQPIDWVLR